ncbi:MAG: hypothetical protein AAFV62_06665 [Pseudomonadota bacterium]
MKRRDFSTLPDLAAGLQRGSDKAIGRYGLFAAVDRLISDGQTDTIDALRPLSLLYPDYDRHVFDALCLFYNGEHDRALERLWVRSQDPSIPGTAQRGYRAWRVFLGSPPLDFEAEPTERLGPVIQYWDKPVPPRDVARHMDAWKTHVGSENYRRFDDESAAAFMREHFGAREEAVYRSCGHPAVKADYLRLGALFVLGGLYIDADAAPCPGFPLLAAHVYGQPLLWFRTNLPEMRIYNGFMGAVAGSPLMADILEEASRRIEGGRRTHVMSMAGPNTVTDVAATAFEEGRLPPIAAVPHHFGKTRLVRDFPARYKTTTEHWHAFEKRLQSQSIATGGHHDSL